MIALAGVDDIDDETSVELVGAQAHGCEISGCVEKSAVRLLDEQRSLAIGEGHDHRALVALGEARLHECFDHAAESVAEETLTAIVLRANLHIERARCLVDLLHRDFDEALPQAHNFRITRLQAQKRLFCVLHRRARGFVLNLKLGNAMRAAVKLAGGIEVGRAGFHLRAAVSVIEIIEGETRKISTLADESRQRHRDGQTPVAEMVLAPNLAAKAFKHARERVADDGGAQMTNMHLLGDIDAAKINDDRVLIHRGRNAEGRAV